MTAIGWFSEKPQHKLHSISSQAQLPGRPSVRGSIAASLAGLSSSQDANSENTTIRTMLDPEKETLPLPPTHNLTASLPISPSAPDCYSPILHAPRPEGRKQEQAQLSPSSQVLFLLPAQILGPSHLKGSCEWWVRGKSMWFSRVHYAQTRPSSAPCLGDKYCPPPPAVSWLSYNSSPDALHLREGV